MSFGVMPLSNKANSLALAGVRFFFLIIALLPSWSINSIINLTVALVLPLILLFNFTLLDKVLYTRIAMVTRFGCKTISYWYTTRAIGYCLG